MSTQGSVVVVGGAGFIGSHLVEHLALAGHDVSALDDLSVGRESFLTRALETGHARLLPGDARRPADLDAALRGADAVVHLAANPDARRGLVDDRVDVALGLETTLEVLSAMRRAGVRRLVFASSGTVYGERAEIAAESDLGALPVSLYGASKLASEAFISAHAACFDLDAIVLRFGNVVGPRATHGVIKDLLDKLDRLGARTDADGALEVLGDGSQEKPYLHVSDCVRGLAFALEALRGGTRRGLTTWNLAPRTQTRIRDLATWVVDRARPGTPLRFGSAPSGWRGDVPVSRLDPSALAAAGVALERTSDDAVRLAIDELVAEREARA